MGTSALCNGENVQNYNTLLLGKANLCDWLTDWLTVWSICQKPTPVSDPASVKLPASFAKLKLVLQIQWYLFQRWFQ